MKDNPYYAIWFSPVKTIENVLLKRVKFTYDLPILIAAISSAFGNDISYEFGFGLTGSILILLIFAAILYIISLYAFPWWIMITGRILNGKSKINQLQSVFGLACIPISIILIYQLLSLLLGEYIGKTQVNYSIQFIVWLFYFRTLVIGIAKSQGFSYGFAIVNLAISVFPVIILKLLIEI